MLRKVDEELFKNIEVHNVELIKEAIKNGADVNAKKEGFLDTASSSYLLCSLQETVKIRYN